MPVSEAERLVRRAGGVRIPAKRHIVYLVRGERFTLHSGTRPNSRELAGVRKQLRRLGLIDANGVKT